MDDLSKLSHEDLLEATIDAAKYIGDDLYDRFGESLKRMSNTEPDWQPIETAPKVLGEEILAWGPHPAYNDHPPTMYVAKWGGDTSLWSIQGICGLMPTHWAPRPKGPANE